MERYKWKHYLTLKDLYTLTQRSTKGTIIVDNGISLDLKLNTINDMTSAGSIEVSPEQISDFKDWRTKLLENSPESIDYEEVNPNPTVAEPVLPTSEQNIKPRVEPTPEAEVVSESPKESVRQASVESETKDTISEAQSKQTFDSNTGEQPPVTDQIQYTPQCWTICYFSCRYTWRSSSEYRNNRWSFKYF